MKEDWSSGEIWLMNEAEFASRPSRTNCAAARRNLQDNTIETKIPRDGSLVGGGFDTRARGPAPNGRLVMGTVPSVFACGNLRAHIDWPLADRTVVSRWQPIRK
jgi:hypothetical protein